MEIIIIAAMAANRVIGENNRLPWHLPGDLRRFKETTMGYPLIMGRKTFESIGRPLPGRKNIILSRDKKYQVSEAKVIDNLNEALKLCKDHDKAFIAGGGEIFREAMTIADTLILSILNREVAGDVYFPKISTENFRESKKVTIKNKEDDEEYILKIFRRKQKDKKNLINRKS